MGREKEKAAGVRIPYGRQQIDDEDIAAVDAVLRSDWITTGPMVGAFEEAVAEYVGARRGVAVSSGTAALHAAMFAIGVGPGDEVIVPPITFAATANAVVFQGGTPVFADVDPDSLLLDPDRAEEAITENTKAILPVDFAGQPCEYDRLRRMCEAHDLWLVADACHALGASYRDEAVGTLADLSAFSFHPVKHITTGEGGMVVTDDPTLADRMRRFRNHGIATGASERAERGTWFYEMVDLGYNLRITDFQCALGRSQLAKLAGWLDRRREIAATYDDAFEEIPGIVPVTVREDVTSAYHLYVVRVQPGNAGISRDALFRTLRSQGIGANVHYVPVHLHPYYRREFGTGPGLCPTAESAYEEILTLPLHPALSEGELQEVITGVRAAVQGARA